MTTDEAPRTTFEFVGVLYEVDVESAGQPNALVQLPNPYLQLEGWSVQPECRPELVSRLRARMRRTILRHPVVQAQEVPEVVLVDEAEDQPRQICLTGAPTVEQISDHEFLCRTIKLVYVDTTMLWGRREIEFGSLNVGRTSLGTPQLCGVLVGSNTVVKLDYDRDGAVIALRLRKIPMVK